MKIASVNNVVEIIEGDTLLIKKRYLSSDRLECELKNLKACLACGLLVPEPLQKVDQITLILEGIKGEIYTYLNEDQIKLCMKELVKFNCCIKAQQKNVIVTKYINGLTKLLALWVSEKDIDLDSDRFGYMLKILRENFDIKQFKDAKSVNWVFQKNHVSMIDFDYVTPSFVLADIAQMIKFQYESFDVNKFIKYYLDLYESYSDEDINELVNLFPLAVLNSCLNTINKNSMLTKKEIIYLDNTITKILNNLKLI